MRTFIIYLLVSSILVCTVPTLSIAQQKSVDLFVGTYTNSGKSEGIYIYQFDENSGSHSLKSKFTGIENPSFLAFNQPSGVLYAIGEKGKGNGIVSSFSYKNGKLEQLNTLPSGSEGPCHVATDKNNQFVFVSNYRGGSLSVYSTNADGSLKKHVQEFSYPGSGPHPSRQEASHVHSATFSPDEKFLLVQDLGTDLITVYPFHADRPEAPLDSSSATRVRTVPGGGPRHITFSENGRFVYVAAELTSSVQVYSFRSGKMKLIQELPMLAHAVDDPSGAADIHLSNDGKFLYTSNRGKINEINIYKVDKESGNLIDAGRQSVNGLTPRNFAVSKNDKFLLVANQNSDEIVVFARDQKTGKLSDTEKRIEVGSPSCLLFN